MSAGPDPQVDSNVIEQERRRLSRRLDEVARLCETNVPAATFYGEMLKRLLESLAAPAGAVWARTAQGHLQLQFQVNLKEVGVDRSEEARASHEELLRTAATQPRQIHLLPHSGVGPAEEGKPAAGNPTDHLLLLVPILNNGQVSGLIEVWQSPNRPLNAVPGFLQFMSLMADLAARYQRHQMLGQMVGQQQLWTQLEAFARQVHGSLNPTEVGYLVANEGRRLIECDRVSVAVRRGGQKARIEAVSGADVVEKRSNLVQLMRKLCDRVIEWGERLVFKGTKDDSLPPKVLDALDAYLAESPSKLLVVEPLHDEREEKDKGKHKRPARAALVMECFEPPADAQQYINRLEVVARHAAPALYNAVEHRRIPMRWVWLPLAKVQEGLGGKARAISALVVVALSLLGSALYLVPYPLKRDANGNLLPVVRAVVYPPEAGIIQEFRVKPNDRVVPGRDLAELFDPKIENKIRELLVAADSARAEARELKTGRNRLANLPPKEAAELEIQALVKEQTAQGKDAELRSYVNSIGAFPKNPELKDRITFAMRAPAFSQDDLRLIGRPEWTVLNSNFREEWRGKEAKPSDPILRLGAQDGPHEIELRIPQKHIGQVLYAMAALEREDRAPVLVVDFLLRTDPTRVYKGRLHKDKIAGQADPNRDDKDEPEPVVLAYVSIDDADIAPGDRLPPEQMLSGAEVHAKVRCGNHRLGYALFYGVWEFFYEKVVFFF